MAENLAQRRQGDEEDSAVLLLVGGDPDDAEGHRAGGGGERCRVTDADAGEVGEVVPFELDLR